MSSRKGKTYHWDIAWKNVLFLSAYHIFALQGLYYFLTAQMYLKTFLFVLVTGIISTQGITSGAHRYWSHRSYKATLPLRLILLFWQTIASQNNIYEWARDHRVHHKFTDTDADPHNATRGFFFSHMGWLLVRKHPDVINKGKTVDMSDLENDPLVTLQKKYFVYLGPLISFVVPTLIPWYFWNEDLVFAWYLTMFRYVVTLHCTWSVNSAAHRWGMKPYDKSIRPTENSVVAFFTSGEGWHNYHHVFPWDYKAVELDKYSGNLSTGFINFMAKIGWAYDLKSASAEMVKKRIRRTGAESSIKFAGECCEEELELSFVEYIDQDDQKQSR